MLSTVTVDIGTTSVKLCLFDEYAHLVASERRSTPTVPDQWGEIYDLDALQTLIADFISALPDDTRAEVRRIALTGVGESGGLVRADASLASPMILWHDHRGADLLAQLGPEQREQIYRVTGLPTNPNYGLSKVAWALQHAGDAAAGAQWLNVAEYLAARMTGTRWSEYSLASRTMALDLETRQWSEQIGDLLGVDSTAFPELRRGTEGAALLPDHAHTTGLPADVRVHVTGHDHMVGAVGADLRPGELLNSTGTTEGLLFLRDQPRLDQQAEQAMLANGIDCTGSDYTLFASIPTGGSAFETLQTMLGVGPQPLADQISTLDGAYRSGAIDLDRVPLVLPRFRGSPPPTKRAADRAVIANLHTDTSSSEVVFGCFLGMVLQFRDVLELFGQQPDRIKVIGPASRNPLWLQLKADLLGVPLSVSRFPEVVSRGAQALASDQPSPWSTSDPHTVRVDPHRHDQLTRWARAVHPQWEHLKATPA